MIIGGGSTGVTLGILLAQNGVHTVIAERRHGIYPLPPGAWLISEREVVVPPHVALVSLLS
jgi:3-(3-hydroxy-phenyl)propionate hydroxylase